MNIKDYDLRLSIKEHIAKVSRSTTVHFIHAEAELCQALQEPLDLASTTAAEAAREVAADPTKGASIKGASPSSQSAIYREGLFIVGEYRSIVRYDLYAAALQDIIAKKEKWSPRVFSLIHWEAFEKAFRKVGRARQISYYKLSNKLLQTNSRNFLYYGTNKNCPCCNVHEETMAHVVACPSSLTIEAKETLLETYSESLENVGTPTPVLHLFIHGIQTWCRLQQGYMSRQLAPTTHDITKSHLTLAYTEQSSPIGWEAFLRGRVSKNWGSAYRGTFPTASEQEIETWLGNVIKINMDLYLALWKHRNEVVFGQDEAAARSKTMEKLREAVTAEYRQYQKDPFMISRQQSRLFESRTLHQRLQQDQDSIKCWLADVTEAKQVQVELRRRAAEAAKMFFVPRQQRPNEERRGGTGELDEETTVTYREEEDSLSVTTATYSF